jgi:hypothetical protein
MKDFVIKAGPATPWTRSPQLPEDDEHFNRTALVEARALRFLLDAVICDRIREHPTAWLAKIRENVDHDTYGMADRWRAPQIVALIDAELEQRTADRD